jgi:ACS family glucarate transporter-like MFS transporter
MGKRRYLVYLGIFLLVAFNYVDRVALSVAAPAIAKELGLDPIQMGYLFSSYIWTYLLFLIPCGFLTDRYGAKLVNGVGVAVWSGATVLTGLAGSFAGLLGSRMLMGAAEASTYPAGGRALRDWAPRAEFGLAATMLNSGGYAGPAFGTLLLGWIVSISDWRWGFFTAGFIGFVWLIGWLVWYRGPEKATFISEEERAFILQERDTAAKSDSPSGGFGRLFRSRSMLAIALAQGCAVYTQIVFLTWLPSYLANVKGLSIMKSGLFTAFPYFLATALSWLLAHLSDRMLTAQGGGSTGRRRLMIVGSMLSAAIILGAPFVDSVPLILAMITISLTGLATGISLNIALTADLLQSPQDAGKAMAIQVSGGNIFGIIAPIATGYIISATGSYDLAFVAGGALLIVGAAVTFTLTRAPIGAQTAPAVAPILDRA